MKFIVWKKKKKHQGPTYVGSLKQQYFKSGYNSAL